MRIGLDSDGDAPIDEIALQPARRPRARRRGQGPAPAHARECCDVIGRLDMPGAIKSLNVSNATAVALYALSLRSEPS